MLSAYGWILHESGPYPGMDYAAVGEALANISEDVKERYRLRATQRGYQPQPVTLVLEEQTNWAGKVPGAAQFVKESLSDIRKVGYQTISIAHGETNTARGGSGGTRKMRDQGELKIVLLDRGLAEVTIKGAEKFRLRFPNPEPYTISTGETALIEASRLAPFRFGEDSASVHPIEVSPAPPVVPAAAPAQISRWDKFRTQSADHPHLVALADWLERREGQSFTAKQLKDDKKLRELFGAVDAKATDGLTLFMTHRFVTQIDDGNYQVLSQSR